MKKLFIILSLLCAVFAVSAQTPTLEDKIGNLETQVSALQQTVNHLQTQVDEVTKQNLSLKQALHLQPTISEYTTPSGINIRLISAVGKRLNGEIIFTFSVENPTRKDLKYSPAQIKMTDENGKVTAIEDKSSTLGGAYLCCGSHNLIPDTPVEMIVKFIVDDEPQYAKALDLPGCFSDSSASRFINIPIKWE